ncbi:MAG: MFS transporter [Spirochaetia bacterium]|jgi:GPH family glycoside/pentoside/hexuronide:cation symporter
MMEGKKLSLGTRLGFGVCDLGGNLFFTIMGFYLLNFMTDVAKLGAGLAGTAMLIGKVCDAITDPTVGFLSDRTKSRWGRRRPWMFWGAIFLFFTMILQYTNPHIESQLWLFIYMAIAYCLLTTAYTMVNIPYGSLTPELTHDFDERTTLNAFRMSFAVVGTFIGAGLVLKIAGAFPSQDTGWTAMSGIMGAVMLITAMITIFTVKEPKRALAEAKEQEGFFKTYAAAFKNRPFVMALATYALHIAGTSVVQGALIYYFRYIYFNGVKSPQSDGAFTLALICMLAPALVFIPVWTMVSRKIGKKWSYNLGMALVAVAVLVIFLFGRQLGIGFFYLVMGIGGIGFSTNYVMPLAIIPDAVELDYANNGVRREGAFYGVWNFMNKVGVALANFINGAILAAFGYVANVPQTEHAKLGIQLLVGPVAAVFFIVGVVVLSFYPITRKYYDTMIMPKVMEWDKKKK